MNSSQSTPNHNDYDPHQTLASEKETFSKPQAISATPPPSIHPLTLILLVIWIIFVGALMWLLERAVALGPKDLPRPGPLLSYQDIFSPYSLKVIPP